MIVSDFNPMRRYDNALRLYNEGRYPDSLAECLSCLDDSLERGPSFGPVIVSFVLGLLALLMAELGDTLPQLQRRRDDLERAWFAGATDVSRTQLLFALNDVLGKQHLSFIIVSHRVASGMMEVKDVACHCLLVGHYVAKTPLSRAGTPSDLALESACFLAATLSARVDSFVADQGARTAVLKLLLTIRDRLLAVGRGARWLELQPFVDRLSEPEPGATQNNADISAEWAVSEGSATQN